MGVFQGSALGPLLFSVFDTQVLVRGLKCDLPMLISSMEESLDSLDKWFSANALKVNAGKTQLFAFGIPQNLRSLPDFEVPFRDTSFVPCNVVTNLGVIFD